MHGFVIAARLLYYEVPAPVSGSQCLKLLLSSEPLEPENDLTA